MATYLLPTRFSGDPSENCARGRSSWPPGRALMARRPSMPVSRHPLHLHPPPICRANPRG